MKKEEPEYKKHLKGIVLNLPETPGIYQYIDENGTIIYVGKAINLKRRVSSYFQKNQKSIKTKRLVNNIRDLKYIVVNNEEEALLLENNLIKRYKPRYNVLLKDDKTYPLICITNEFYPRIFVTRRRLKGLGTYYGPYTYSAPLVAVMGLIKQIYSMRRCQLQLTPERINQGKFKLCLDYHIKTCKGPCCGLQSHEDYMKDVSEIKEILRGNTQTLLDLLMDEMKSLSQQMKFEEAQILKEKYELIESYRAKSAIVNSYINADVFTIEMNENIGYINYLHITNGAVNQAFTFEYRKQLDESEEELLQLGIIEMRERYGSKSPEIIVPFKVYMNLANTTFTIPQKGEKKKLLELSLMNVKQYKLDRLKQAEKLDPDQKRIRLLKEIQDQLKLAKLPAQIECFDNSNISGSDAVAACVVFKMGKPSKNDYRKYNIKTVVGPDDYASMREVVGRRYKRIIEEGGTLPDLIITDGGKGQMEVVREVIEDELELKIPIAGLAKDNKHRTSELLYGFPPVVIGIKQSTPLFHLLENIQNEVHRFAIKFHRNKRSKSQIASVLDNIKGVGQSRKEALLKAFKSAARIKAASEEEIAAVIGKAAAKNIKEKLNGDS
ncbi:excinuclease ABC subunit UvrC [Phocaeicola paurosaccharolyticus]|uniref:excinuclease ABC subunit UvrC n=1 Tax=Phocaeicola paurosaccharolyticus TaxID=732242 RepID=UPI00046B0772|nr:excinuclease ABC subunit UvrC [Phocaeicola paurosaccharolyticus]